MTEIRDSYDNDIVAQRLIQELLVKSSVDGKFSFKSGLLYYKDKIYIGGNLPLQERLIKACHDAPWGGHSGVKRTYSRLQLHFYWPKMLKMVTSWVAKCDICIRCKTEHCASPGLLQPLPVPQGAWQDISLDFVEKLPKSLGFDIVLVVIDRFTKYGHFIPLSHPFSAAVVAKAFMDNILKLHGLPRTIVSDRDRIFTGVFWRELMNQLGTKLVYSSAYHPQTDGQTERVNQCLEAFLLSMCFLTPKKWATWLSLAEIWYNTIFHSSINMSPFQALYGYQPQMPGVFGGTTAVAAVEDMLTIREKMNLFLKDSLAKAQNRMKQYADNRRTDREFTVGDWVFLKLQPYRQQSVSLRASKKLSARLYGPFRVAAKVGKVAYQLDLPSTSKVHPVFHVSLLKRRPEGASPALTTVPPSDDGLVPLQPAKVINERHVEIQGQPVFQLLVQWQGLPSFDATWEDSSLFEQQYPEFYRFWGQERSNGGGIVRYSRKKGDNLV